MANTKLGSNALREICECIEACADSKQISAEADRLATHFGVSKSQIYSRTKEIRNRIITRKSRSDKGKRIADLMSHPVLKQIAAWCVGFNIDPAEAFELARKRNLEIPVEIETFRRYMNEHEINAKSRRDGKTAHRSFEASRPGEMFQFDISGTKQRWFDTRLRKIISVSSLEVSENHANANKSRVRVWRFKLLDDKSRVVFSRYYGVEKPNSSHVIDFLLQAYAELGVPEKLFTDNDAIIKFGRNADATKTLGRALKDVGGYEVIHHLPGNARATGKIERQHQESEKSEKLIGLFLAEGRNLTLDDLNEFARNKDAQYNNTRHRTTGEKPIDRWNAQIHTVRKIDYQILKSAFLADRFDINLRGDLSFDLQGTRYQLPTNQEFQNLYERQQITKQKLHVIFAHDVDFFTLVDFDLNEYDIPKALFAPDVAGEFKSTAESKGERNRKELKKFAKEQAKIESERGKVGVIHQPIPYFDTENAVEIAAQTEAAKVPGVLQFPTPSVDVTANLVDALPAGRGALIENYAGKLFSFVAAVREYRDEFIQNNYGDEDAGIAACKQFLDTVFPTREDQLPQSEIESALQHYRQPQRILRAV